MGFFEQIFGTELGLPARAVVALVLVLALIALTVWLMRRFGDTRVMSRGNGRGRQQRLAVLDSAVVDARRRLVLIRRDNVEHLLLIGGPSDVVVEPNIVRAAPPAAARPARPGVYETVEAAEETPLIPTPEPAPAEAERPAPPAPARPAAAAEPPRTVPRPAAQPELHYAEMAQRLEAALRKAAPEPEAARPAPAAPTPRAPEPRIFEPRPAAPAPRAPEPRAPGPRAPEPRAAEKREPESQSAPAASKPAPQAAADVFSSLEEEMASLLRPGGQKPQ